MFASVHTVICYEESFFFFFLIFYFTLFFYAYNLLKYVATRLRASTSTVRPVLLRILSRLSPRFSSVRSFERINRIFVLINYFFRKVVRIVSFITRVLHGEPFRATYIVGFLFLPLLAPPTVTRLVGKFSYRSIVVSYESRSHFALSKIATVGSRRS